MEMQGIKRMRGSKAEGFREQQNVNAKERQRRRNGKKRRKEKSGWVWMKRERMG